MVSILPHSLLTTLIAQLQTIQKEPKKSTKRCLIGFDGFTDEIIHVVATRLSSTTFQRIETIEQLGARITAAAGKSANIELVTTQQKLGGNAPILTNALIEGGHAITFAGAIGQPGSIEPLFQAMAARCTQVFSLCPSAHSDALEFFDGKLILGKHLPLVEVNYPNLLKAIPKNTLIDLLGSIDLFASVNWTMLLSMNELWQQLLTEVLPTVNFQNAMRWLFVDLADPAKRSDNDLLQALRLLQAFRKYYTVVLALNEAEALRLARLYGHTSIDATDLLELAQMLQRATTLDQIVIHIKQKVVAATITEQFQVTVPFCQKPRLTTGAGDNFNAGYCNALLHGLNPEQSLALGISTSGFYVRNGRSPTLEELTQFLHDWNNGKLNS